MKKQIRYADFPAEEYEARIRRAGRAMADAGLDALIVTEPANLRYLFGFQNMMQLSANRSFVGVLPREHLEEGTLFIPHDCQDAPSSWTTHITFWDEGHDPPFDDLIGGQTEAIKASVYQKPNGGALIVVYNVTREHQTAALTIDWRRLQAETPLNVVDAYSEESLPMNGRTLKLNVPPLNYRLVWMKK
jgi:Xaa-Pro aminopeptidase